MSKYAKGIDYLLLKLAELSVPKGWRDALVGEGTE